jgi:Zn-dependent protease
MFDLAGDPLAFLQSLILKIPALLLAVTIHECAHGFVADRLGDPTARLSGRLTLNPLPHIDPIGALALVLAGFGWAKPVPVNAGNFKHPTRDMAWVAVAGPLSNFLAAFVALVLLALARSTLSTPFIAEPLGGVLIWVYQFNLALAVFNLIPLPPLDGGHFLPHLFPRASWSALHQLEQYGSLILILLVMTGAIDIVIGPIVRMVSKFYIFLVGVLF